MPALAADETKPTAVTYSSPGSQGFGGKEDNIPSHCFLQHQWTEIPFQEKKGDHADEISYTFCPEHRRKNLPYNEVEPCGI